MKDAATPVPAATVLMLRDGAAGLETFMVVRHRQSDFASGALVFPGGKIDAQDHEVQDYCHGMNGADDLSAALMAGAIREAFEECGILLAREQGADALVSGARLKALAQYREPLNKGRVTLRAFLAGEGLMLACDRLRRFAHWITPAMMPKRFDTHFYLAAAPADHLAAHDGHESVDSVWISPRNALDASRDGTYTIIFPTRQNLALLSESDSVAGALQMATARTIVPVLPWTEQREDGKYLCIPPAAGYAVSEERLPAR